MARKRKEEEQAPVRNVPFFTTHLDTTGTSGFNNDLSQVSTAVAYVNSQTQEALRQQFLAVHGEDKLGEDDNYDEVDDDDELAQDVPDNIDNPATVDVSEEVEAIKDKVREQQEENLDNATEAAENAADELEQAQKDQEKADKAVNPKTKK